MKRKSRLAVLSLSLLLVGCAPLLPKHSISNSSDNTSSDINENNDSSTTSSDNESTSSLDSIDDISSNINSNNTSDSEHDSSSFISNESINSQVTSTSSTSSNSSDENKTGSLTFTFANTLTEDNGTLLTSSSLGSKFTCDYLLNVDSISKIYNGKYSTLKCGSSSAGGSFRLNFSGINITSCEIEGYGKSSNGIISVNGNLQSTYSSDDTYSFTNINSNSLLINCEEGNGTSPVFYITSIKIEFDITGDAPNPGGGGSEGEIEETNYSVITLDKSNQNSLSGTYSTGNYGMGTISSITYEYYRSIDYSSGLISLLPAISEGGIGGSLANQDAIRDIDYITIEYNTITNCKLSVGNTLVYSNTYVIPASSTSYTFDLRNVDANYFMIETGSDRLNIKNIEIKFGDSNVVPTTNYKSSGENLYRLNPVTYSGSLVDGESYVDVPMSINVSGSSYTIAKTKRLTYYSYDYIQSNPSSASEAAYTDSKDVAAYFIAFGTYPANYVDKSSYSNATNYFGNDTRCVSYYTRTDGYVNYVPYANGSGNKPHYYECDIALDSSYSSGARGVGRVVVFVDGYSQSKGATNYDSSPVAVYTDDHYTTFQEYYNNGTFSNRYNAINDAASTRTFYKYGAPTTLK